MATCELENDASSPQSLIESEDEKEIPINVNDVEIFQKDVSDLNVIDVYNIAASIGREFEKLTDAFGGAIFSDVMPKMIRVLEMLEAFASRSQNYSTDVVELQAAVQKLQIDNKADLEKHKEDLELVEAAWREETKQLLKSVETLQEDNKGLTQLLTERIETPSNSQNNKESEKSVLSILNESVEKQRDELREKNSLLEQQTSECEALSAQAQQLTKLNVNLRRKINLMEQQVASISNQNSDVETTCKEKDRQIKELQKRLAEVTTRPVAVTVETESRTTSATATETQEVLVDPLLANKLVIDLTDPERPRYTLNELREVLDEKNRLKLQCFLQEDELKYYRQKEESWEEISPKELSSARQQHEMNNNSATEQKQESKIKKLFSSIFSRDVKSTPIRHDPPKPCNSHYVRFDIPNIDMCEEVEENTIDENSSRDTHATRTSSFTDVDLNVPEHEVPEALAITP